MKIRVVIILIVFVMMPGYVSLAQNQIVNTAIEELLESLGDNLNDETDITEVLNTFEYYLKNPLNINTATPSELADLYFLSIIQIDNLIVHIKKNGAVLSIYELATVDGFTQELAMKIEPLISFENESLEVSKRKNSNELISRLTKSFFSGTETDFQRHEGNQFRYYMRLKHTSSDIEYGLVSEKDPGEAFFAKSNKYGFDYYSAHVNFKIGKSDNRLFLGDYNVRFGQGLVVWQGFSMGKSVEATQVYRANTGIRSYSSTDENQFFRGVAGKFRLKKVLFNPFISFNKIDANIYTDGEDRYFSAFQTSGYHRFGSEVSGENSLNQYVAGINSSFDIGTFNIGATSVYTGFNPTHIRTEEPYNKYFPIGKNFISTGFNWKGTFKKNFIFGEAAFNKNNGRALITGIVSKPVSNFEIAMAYRNINRHFFSYFSNSFTESSRTNDENSIYLGIKFYPASKWVVSAYSDFFKHKWLKYTTAAPSSGVESLVQVSYSPTRNSNIYLKIFTEDKDQRLITPNLRYNEVQSIKKLRLNFILNLTESISLKSRIELSDFTKLINDNGFLIFQDFVYKNASKIISFNGRLAYFKTDSYNSRIYAYENDLLYSFSIPALFGNGIRTYANLNYKISERLSLWFKFANTSQFQTENNGVINNSSSKQELKFQIRFRF